MQNLPLTTFDGVVKLVKATAQDGTRNALMRLNLPREQALMAETGIPSVVAAVEQAFNMALLQHVMPYLLSLPAGKSEPTCHYQQFFVHCDLPYLDGDDAHLLGLDYRKAINALYSEGDGTSNTHSIDSHSAPLPCLTGDDSGQSSGQLTPVAMPDWVTIEQAQSLLTAVDLSASKPMSRHLPMGGTHRGAQFLPRPQGYAPGVTMGPLSGPMTYHTIPVERKGALPRVVEVRLMEIIFSHPALNTNQLDNVVGKLAATVECYGVEACLQMLDGLHQKLKADPGMYGSHGCLNAIISSHVEHFMLNHDRAAGMKEHARQFLPAQLFEELEVAINCNRWLKWTDFDQGIFHFIKRLSPDVSVDRMRLLRSHSFKNAKNIKGCIMSLLSSGGEHKPKNQLAQVVSAN